MSLFDKPPQPRRFIRTRYNQPVHLKTALGGEALGAAGCDLSQGGIKLYVSEFIPVGTELGIELQFGPQHQVTEICGIVRWISEMPGGDRYQIGLEFFESALQQRKRIAQHVFFD